MLFQLTAKNGQRTAKQLTAKTMRKKAPFKLSAVRCKLLAALL
jgi:hypothetical protein